MPKGEFYIGLCEIDPQGVLQFEELLIALEGRIAKAAREDPCHCTLDLLKRGCASYLWRVHDSTPRLPACYGNFAERISATMPNAHADAIVSFNWDVVVEQALKSASNGLPWSYSKCCPGISVLKPHGSINWSSHGALGYQGHPAWQPIGPESNLCFVALAPFRNPCSQGVNEDFRYMVFPGGAGSSLDPDQELIWKEIEDVISQREKIVFIGYSLPIYDSITVERLLRSANGKQIEAYNPSAEHLSRYREVFGPRADTHAESFEQCVYAAAVSGSSG
jgi:hypothetical protein